MADEALSLIPATLFRHGTARQAWNSPVLLTPWQTISAASLIERAPVKWTNVPGSWTKSLKSFRCWPCQMRARPKYGLAGSTLKPTISPRSLLVWQQPTTVATAQESSRRTHEESTRPLIVPDSWREIPLRTGSGDAFHAPEKSGSCPWREWPAIVYGSAEILLASDIALGSLNGCVSEKKLDLFQLAAGGVAEASARPT